MCNNKPNGFPNSAEFNSCCLLELLHTSQRILNYFLNISEHCVLKCNLSRVYPFISVFLIHSVLLNIPIPGWVRTRTPLGKLLFTYQRDFDECAMFWPVSKRCTFIHALDLQYVNCLLCIVLNAMVMFMWMERCVCVCVWSASQITTAIKTGI